MRELGLPFRQVEARRAHLDTLLAKAFDVVGAQQKRVVPFQRVPLALGLLEFRASILQGAFGLAPVLQGFLEPPARVRRQVRRLAEFAGFGVQAFQVADAEERPPDPAQPAALCFLGSYFRGAALEVLLALLELPAQRFVVAGAHRLLAQLAFGVLPPVHRLIEEAAPRTVLPQAAGLFADAVQPTAQLLDARPGGEQSLAGFVALFEDLAAALAQPLVVQAEHALEEVPVRRAEERAQRPLAFRQRRAVCVEQGTSLALAAEDLELFAPFLQHRADPHAGVRMQEIVRRPAGNAEEQVFQGRQGGGFAGLVGAVDDMQVQLPPGELQGRVGKATVAQQIQAAKAHATACLPANGPRRAGSPARSGWRNRLPPLPAAADLPLPRGPRAAGG